MDARRNLTGESKMDLPKNLPAAWTKLDAESTRLARILRTLLQILIGLTLLLYLNALATTNLLAVFVAATLLLAVELVAWFLLQRGAVRPASLTLIFGLWASLTLATFVGQMEGNVAWMGLTLVVLIAGLLLGGRAALLVAGLNTLVGFSYLTASLNGLLTEPLLPYSPAGLWFSLSVIFFASGGLIYLSNASVRQALERAAAHERSQMEANQQLEAMRASLEAIVAERTRELEKRTAYLQAGIEVSRATASILDTRQLMQTAVDVMREQFDLYYVGLFVVDPSGEWALLQAGTGEAGRQMLARGHRIRVGSGMVGWSVANAQPRLALDVGEDAVRLATPELPETRSEAAIPLRTRGKVLGALSVQSQKPAAFGEMEIAVFQALADQLAIALDNARLFSESQQALKEAQRAYGQISRRAWQEFLRASNVQGMSYRYGEIEARASLSEDAQLSSARRQVIETRRAVQLQVGERPTLLMPIPVRDQVVGVMRFTKDPASQANHPTVWQEDEIELLETICEQLGVALDGARLYQEAQRLAYREQLTGEVTSRIRQTLDIQTVLRTAVEEIQRTLNLPEVMISLASEPELTTLSDEAPLFSQPPEDEPLSTEQTQPTVEG
mgnify:CR=1 FL=1